MSGAWDNLFSQIAAPVEVMEEPITNVDTEDTQAKRKSALPLSQAPEADQRRYEKLDRMYDIPYVLKRIRQTTISARMLERVCMGGRDYSFGVFFRRPLNLRSSCCATRYVVCDEAAEGAKRYDLHNDYVYRMRVNMKENFDAFSRGREYDTPHGQLALCKVCVYGWAVYSGVLDHIEGHPVSFFREQKMPRIEGVIRIPTPVMYMSPKVVQVVGTRGMKRVRVVRGGTTKRRKKKCCS